MTSMIVLIQINLSSLLPNYTLFQFNLNFKAIMESSSSHHNFIDYFKLFKVYDLKKIEKTGIVKIIQDKVLARKVLSVEGNISTSNFITFNTNNYPNIPFSERFLYVQGFVDSGKSFCMQITYSLGNKQFKAVYSSLYKAAKKHLQNIVHLPLSIVAQKWNILVIDLYDLGLHFGFKPLQMKLIFRVNAVEVRASSKVKGMFQSDYLFSVDKIPKDMVLPLKKEQNFFQKYAFSVETTDQSSLKYSKQVKQSFLKQIVESKKQVSLKKNQISRQKIQRSSNNKTSAVNQKPTNDKEKSVEKKQLKAKNTSKLNVSRKNLPPHKDTKQKEQKNKQKNQQIQPEEAQPEQLQLQPPKPQGTITMSLSCVQGYSINKGTITTVQSYILKPNFMPTHKKIKVVCECDDFNVKMITGYIDGSICVWDTVRKQPLSYFMTELNEIREIKVDQKMTLVIVGLDKMKREVIIVVSNNSVIFRQISTFNISGLELVNPRAFQQGFITFGFENIRLWRVNNEKSIIQGSSIYLGQTNRKVKYNSAIVIKTLQDYIAFVVDSNGFITTISVTEGKMLQSIKVGNSCIDNITLLKNTENNQLVRAVISDQLGVIKILNLQRMELMEQLNLNNRILSIKQINNSDQFTLTHYNKSIGVLNLQSGLYSFVMRSHTARIESILYSQYFNKVISIGKDCSIRIWLYVSGSETTLLFYLQQQYQFIITGQELIAAVCGEQGKSEDMKYVIVGSDSGKIRLIDVQRFAIKEEIVLQMGRMGMSMSRNGRYIVCTYQSGNSYLLDLNLNILKKYLSKSQKKRTKNNWINGFNKFTKQFYFQNLDQTTICFYNLKDLNNTLFCIRSNDIKSIEAIGDNTFALSSTQIMIYNKDTMIQMISFEQYKVQSFEHSKTVFSYPIVCFVSKEKIMVRVIGTNLQQQVELPEQPQNLSIYFDQTNKQGKIFFAGTQSFAIYVISFQLHNFSASFAQVSQLVEQINQIQVQQEQKGIEISFSKTSFSGFTNKQMKQTVKNQRIVEPPRQLKKLYAEEQQIYEEVKEYLFPNKFKKEVNEPEQNQFQTQNIFVDEVQSQGIALQLSFGYELRQEVQNQKEVGSFLWISQNNSLILQTGNKKDILQHFFSVPVKHKVLNFPSTITSMCASHKSFEEMKYLVVCVNNIIKVYNVYEQLSYIRTIESISVAFPMNVIFLSAITNCNSYIVALSHNNVHFDNKIYIQIIEITTGNIISSSYLSLPPIKNKHKGMQIKQAKQYKLLLNPYKSSLQFILYNSQGAFHFYRITSVLTLQTIQLQEMIALSKDKMGQLTSACFIDLGTQAYEDAVIAVGSENGSISFVDTRTANILIACIGLIPNVAVTSLSFSRSDDEQNGRLMVFTNTTNVYVYELFNGINTILASMEGTKIQNSRMKQEENKKWMILDGQVTAKSNVSGDNQQLIVTKCGSLWLLDYADFVTVKVSSIHTNTINKAEVLSSSKGQSCLITCADDGCVKLTNLINMEQILQIYKPRKQAKTFCLQGSFTLISFAQEVFIYNKLDYENSSNSLQLSSYGSFKCQTTVVNIQNIPTTNNYYILTENEVLIIYLSSKQQKNKNQLTLKSISSLNQELSLLPKKYEVQVQIQKITEVQNPLKLLVNSNFAPYDQFLLVSRPGKATVWSRKCFKKNYNHIQQLINVHQLSFYLIDATTRNTVDTSYVQFVSQNQYLWGLYEQGLIHIRNFREHVVVREINLSIQGLTSMSCLNIDQLYFVMGDKSGSIYLVNENGLVIQRKKALQSSIKGLSTFNYLGRKKIVAYGSKYVAVMNNIGIK